MITHTIHWFESEDGRLFTDEMECLDHEVNLLYQNSGVRFYIGDQVIERIKTENDQTYSEMTDIFIDRTKADENRRLCEAIDYALGWDYVVDALEGTGKHYHLPETMADKMEEVE